jgi:hypothetical protein
VSHFPIMRKTPVRNFFLDFITASGEATLYLIWQQI